MEGKRLIEKIRLRNILSFGDKGEEIELQPLNIIIGQNASGKSNLVDVIKLLRSLPYDKGLVRFISQNGGINGWVWKGKKSANVCEVGMVINCEDNTYDYNLKFAQIDTGLEIIDELIALKDQKIHIAREEIISGEYSPRKIASDETVIGNVWDIEIQNKEYDLFSIQFYLEKVKVYADLNISRKSEIRMPQLTDVPNDFLEENGTNLNLVLNDFEFRGELKHKIVDLLKKVNSNIEDYSVRVLGGTVQLFIRERNFESPMGILRISNGTLQLLCLLVILCHPEPPPLICIEEPETGLHPDILPTIAELMIEASQRTQLIVTTHSDILVSAFSEIPEAVLVCEKDEDGTHFKRLEKDKLKDWLKEYELGEMWLKGEIGGTRW